MLLNAMCWVSHSKSANLFGFTPFFLFMSYQPLISGFPKNQKSGSPNFLSRNPSHDSTKRVGKDRWHCWNSVRVIGEKSKFWKTSTIQNVHFETKFLGTGSALIKTITMVKSNVGLHSQKASVSLQGLHRSPWRASKLLQAQSKMSMFRNEIVHVP